MINAGISVSLALAAATPLMLAIAMMTPWRLRLCHLTPLAALPALAVALFMPVGAEATYPWLFLGLELRLDATGKDFLLLTAVLWLAAGIYALGYLRTASRRADFHLWFLLAMGGNLGLVLAGDVIGFYAFFTIMSLAAYGLVVFERNDEAWRAGRVYIALAVLGEIILFAGLVLHVTRVDAYAFPDLAGEAPEALALWLLIAGFGIKAGLLPLHVWLPLAHPVAPTPASAVLSGAMIKAGLLGWLRVLPIGEVGMPTLGAVLVALGLAAAFFGVVVGLVQSRPKTLLAYSSISQMGLMTAGVGLALALPDAATPLLIAVTFYALHHGIAKAALFLGVGVMERVRARWTWVLFSLPALALAGLPFTSGAMAKTALKLPLAEETLAWIPVVEWLLILAAVGTTLLMVRLLWQLYTDPHRADPHRATDRLPWSMAVPWASLALGALMLPWLWPPAIAVDPLAPYRVWAATWPVFLGLAIAWVATRLGARLRLPRIPEGDLWLPMESLLAWTWQCARTGPGRWLTPGEPRTQQLARGAITLWRHSRIQARRGEAWLTRWEHLGLIIMTLILVLFAVLWLG